MALLASSFPAAEIVALKAALNGGRSKSAIGVIRAGVKWAGADLRPA